MIVLNDGMASRYHCVIEMSPEGLRVRDLDSSNGTRVNGQVVKAWKLGDGDVVNIGRSSITCMPQHRSDAQAGRGAGAWRKRNSRSKSSRWTRRRIAADPSDHEAQLVRMAESLADKKFTEDDIILYNARGGLRIPANPRRRTRRGLSKPRKASGIYRLILLVCFRTRATDIHIEPKQDDYSGAHSRGRTMVDVVRLPKEVGIRVTSLIKILCDIDIAQKKIVQEGHLRRACRIGGWITASASRRRCSGRSA